MGGGVQTPEEDQLLVLFRNNFPGVELLCDISIVIIRRFNKKLRLRSVTKTDAFPLPCISQNLGRL